MKSLKQCAGNDAPLHTQINCRSSSASESAAVLGVMTEKVRRSVKQAVARVMLSVGANPTLRPQSPKSTSGK